MFAMMKNAQRIVTGHKSSCVRPPAQRLLWPLASVIRAIVDEDVAFILERIERKWPEK
jgi:hypothetical protein